MTDTKDETLPAGTQAASTEGGAVTLEDGRPMHRVEGERFIYLCMRCGDYKPRKDYMRTFHKPGNKHTNQICNACRATGDTEQARHGPRADERMVKQLLAAEVKDAKDILRVARAKKHNAAKEPESNKRRSKLTDAQKRLKGRERSKRSARSTRGKAIRAAGEEIAKAQLVREAVAAAHARAAKARIRGEANAATRELARRLLARQHMLPFVMRNKPDYQPGWVHKDICRRLEKFSEDVAAGKSPRLILAMPPRAGKLLADSTPILTMTGWKVHGDLQPGDFVFHPSGRPTEVLTVSPTDTADFVVETTDGARIQCHGAHEWTVYDRSRGRWRTMETQELAARALWSGERAVMQLPSVEALQFEQKPLAMSPYVLGAWLGDGTSCSPCITHAPEETEVVAAIAANGYEVSAVVTHQATGVKTTHFAGGERTKGAHGAWTSRMTLQLQRLGVWKNKHIPADYLQSSIEQRLELLAGLIDTDGTVCKKTGRVSFSTCSQQLANGATELVRSFGWHACVHTAEPKLSTSGIQGRKPTYIVAFNPTLAIPTRLPRKATTKLTPQSRRVGIRSVTRAEVPESGRCIQVDSEDGLYLAGEQLTPTHNSELASVQFPAWHLGRHPDHEVISASHTAALANGFSRRVRAIMRSQHFRTVFPDTILDKDSQNTEGWMTTKGGGYTPIGVGGALVGRGCNCLIIDDPIKNAEEAESEVSRDNTWEWYTTSAYTRLAPGGGVLVIAQRWHGDDLTGRLERFMKEGIGDEWEIVRYPAVAEVDETYRKKGEALHPERYDIEALRSIERAVGPRVWSALYQQNPVQDEGSYFSRDMVRTFDDPSQLPKRLTYYTTWDLAISKNDRADWTVGLTVGIDEEDNMWVVDLVRKRMDSLEIVEAILDSQNVYPAAATGIEKSHVSMAIGPLLAKRQSERKAYTLNVVELTPGRRDKELRARAIQGRMKQGRVFIPSYKEWYGEFVAELLAFPFGQHDDMVDALAWVGLMLFEMNIPPTPRAPKKDSWVDRIAKVHLNRRNHLSA